MFILQLTEAERNNLLIFLNRVELKGSEASSLAALQFKVSKAAVIKTPDTEVGTEIKKEGDA